MSDFLEYYRLLLEEGRDLPTDKQVWSSVGKLPQEHLEFIYFLVLHDYLVNGGEDKSNPYGCKTQMGGKGVLFTVDKLPERVQKVIIAYLARISR